MRSIHMGGDANDELPVEKILSLARAWSCGALEGSEMMFKRNSVRLLLPLALLSCSTFLGSSAAAQALSAPGASTSDNTDERITTIIVTARKLGEDIQSI